MVDTALRFAEIFGGIGRRGTGDVAAPKNVKLGRNRVGGRCGGDAWRAEEIGEEMAVVDGYVLVCVVICKLQWLAMQRSDDENEPRSIAPFQ